MEVIGVQTQSELAKHLGYKGVSAISNWKDGKIDWNRIISRIDDLSSPDMNYIIYGEAQSQRPIDKSWNRLEGAVTSRGISGAVQDRMIASLRDRAKNLAEDLLYFSEMADRIESATRQHDDESP